MTRWQSSGAGTRGSARCLPPSSCPRCWWEAPASAVSGLREMTHELGLDLPVLDLSGLDAEAALEVIEALPAGKIR